MVDDRWFCGEHIIAERIVERRRTLGPCSRSVLLDPDFDFVRTEFDPVAISEVDDPPRPQGLGFTVDEGAVGAGISQSPAAVAKCQDAMTFRQQPLRVRHDPVVIRATADFELTAADLPGLR